jgi:meso-butanediol dehydrogenase/(S,S)-butanediol dehydrogenase/diacetyl reductase
MRRFEGKVALITGGTSGIGQATVELFVAEGASVAYTGRRLQLGQHIESRLNQQNPGRVKFIQADHRSSQACSQSVEATLDAFGRIDVLFNNAGIVVSGTAETTSEADWEDTLALNITAVWRMSRLVIPIMRRQGGGVIVNNASDWGLVGAKEVMAYCASKGAVVQMTKAMALDHAHENIRINALCPGDTFVERWVQDGFYRDSGAVTEAEARLPGDIPLGRVAEAQEIGRVVLFLASEDASFITGTTLVADGGNTAR